MLAFPALLTVFLAAMTKLMAEQLGKGLFGLTVRGCGPLSQAWQEERLRQLVTLCLQLRNSKPRVPALNSLSLLFLSKKLIYGMVPAPVSVGPPAPVSMGPPASVSVGPPPRLAWVLLPQLTSPKNPLTERGLEA